MKIETENKFKQIENLRDFLLILREDFDSKNSKPSGFVKTTLIYGLKNELSKQGIFLTPKTNDELLNSTSMYGFISILLSCIEKVKPLSEKQKLELLNASLKVIALTNLKELEIKHQKVEAKPEAKKTLLERAKEIIKRKK